MNDPEREPADDDAPESAIRVATEGESWLGPAADDELTPGSPSLENVAFVLLGVVVTLVVLAQFVL